MDTRFRYPGLQISPDLAIIFDGRLRRKLAVTSRLKAALQVSELPAPNRSQPGQMERQLSGDHFVQMYPSS